MVLASKHGLGHKQEILDGPTQATLQFLLQEAHIKGCDASLTDLNKNVTI